MGLDGQFEGRRLRVILATVGINIIAIIAFAFSTWSDWRTGFALNIFDNLLLVGFAFRYRDRLMTHLIFFGLVVGFLELATDAWLVAGTRTLDYSIGGGPMIWRSPIWMPIAWEIVAVQFSYIGLRLVEWRGITGAILAGVFGAINIPFYEEMALRTHWWRYSNCRMILHTPCYIIIAEFLIAVIFALLARQLRREQWLRTFTTGIIGGCGIFIAAAIGFWICEGWPKS